MPALISGCTRRHDDQADVVILRNPTTGAEVRVNAWEARLLPFLEQGADAKEIARLAQAAGTNLPAEHVQALLGRLTAAGLMVAAPPVPASPAVAVPTAAVAPPTVPEPSVANDEVQTRIDIPRSAFPDTDTDPVRLNLNSPLLPVADRNTPIEDAWVRPEPSPGIRPPRPSASSGPSRPRSSPAVRSAAVSSIPTELMRARANPMRVAISRRLKAPAIADEPRSEPQPEDAGESRSGGSGVRRLRNVAIAVGGLLVALAIVPWPFGIVAPCVLQASGRQQVQLPIKAVIQSVTVDEGQVVKSGDLLATLDLVQLKSDQARTLDQIGALTAELKLIQGAGQPTHLKLRELVDQRGAQMRVAYLEFRRAEDLRGNGLSNEVEMKTASASIAVARRALAEAQTALADAMASTPDQIRRKELEIERLNVLLGQENDLVAQPEIRSPIDGTIAGRDVPGRAGQPLEAGTSLMEIVQLQPMRAEARLPQHTLGKVHVGARVRIGVSGIAQTYTASLERVGSEIEVDAGQRFVRVVAFVDNPQLTLRQNAEGWLELEAERESILRALLWRAGLIG